MRLRDLRDGFTQGRRSLLTCVVAEDMKRSNFIAITLIGGLMLFISVRVLILEELPMYRRRWVFNTRPDTLITGDDAKWFGIVGLILGLLIIGAGIAGWINYKEP
jgi:hypothetical protein